MTAEERWRKHRAEYRVREVAAAKVNAELIKGSVDIDGHGCWNWLGKTSKGYGYLTYGGMTLPAHRLAYLAFVGEIPDGMVIDHLCENKGCANPEHLEPVPTAENSRRYYAAVAARKAAFA